MQTGGAYLLIVTKNHNTQNEKTKTFRIPNEDAICLAASYWSRQPDAKVKVRWVNC